MAFLTFSDTVFMRLRPFCFGVTTDFLFFFAFPFSLFPFLFEELQRTTRNGDEIRFKALKKAFHYISLYELHNVWHIIWNCISHCTLHITSYRIWTSPYITLIHHSITFSVCIVLLCANAFRKKRYIKIFNHLFILLPMHNVNTTWFDEKTRR